MSRVIGSSYQYLQRSKIPTYKFQKSLPRLKIPKLEDTYQRYLAALNPIFANDPNLKQSTDLAKHFFQDGEAKDLHGRLLEYDKTVKHTSYINEFWFNMYLSSRLPLPLNFNPFLAWKDASSLELNDQLVRGTNLLISAVRFKRSLEENVLEPEIYHLDQSKKTADLTFYQNLMAIVPESIATYVSFAFKAFPLDMSQYNNLFNSTRIPRKAKDEILKSDPKTNRHVVVLRHGEFFVFDLLDQDGNLLPSEHIYANLHYIVNQNRPNEDHKSISELTTAERNLWAEEREHLVNLSAKNKANLAKLDSAMFALCLDDVSYEPHQQIEGAHNFLHGSNRKGPTNRWFDKSFSIIMTKDGHSCINFEHSWGDGVAVLRFFNEIYRDSENNPQITSRIENPTSSTEIRVEKLSFDLDSRLKDAISKSRLNHLQITDNLELGAVQYEKFSKDYFKKKKLSADSMSQLAFQMAFKKVHNNITPVTYESCSTAAFKGGRTETIRPCTNETNKVYEALMRNKSSSSSCKNEVKELLKNASKEHFRLCKEASLGDGFDRHLFGLKEIALRSGNNLPKFYSDPILLRSQHYTLSTSTLHGECFSGGGFAPVVEDGFGLGYGYVDDTFGVLVSSYKNKRNNTQYVQALNESLDDLRKIFES